MDSNQKTYDLENPKRVYYLSMEFLIGRSLANNVTNLTVECLAPIVFGEAPRLARHLSSRSPTPAWAMADWATGRLLHRLAGDLEDPRDRLRLRYEYGIFRQSISNGWQHERPDNWLRRLDPWEVSPAKRRWRCRVRLLVRDANGRIHPVPGWPSTCLESRSIGRSWATAERRSTRSGSGLPRQPDYFDFDRFSRGEFVEALTDKIAAESLTRVLYPDDSTVSGQALRFVQEYFLVACSLADLVRRFPAAPIQTGARYQGRLPFSSTTHTRRWPSPS